VTGAGHGSAGGHELRDARVGIIGLAFIGLGVSTLASLLIVYVVLRTFTLSDVKESTPASPLAVSEGRKAPPEPRLQIAPRDDLRRLHAREDAMLRGYGWVNRDAGVARIPIDRAMDLLAERGLPAQPAPPAGGRK
jgi:hypothetical protein